MSNYSRLGSDDAYQMLLDGTATIVDMRDIDSYKAGHITDAEHIENDNVQAFIDSADHSRPVIVCCYHGNMSQSAGAYLAEKGFNQVYSLDGGFAGWAAKYPDEVDTP